MPFDGFRQTDFAQALVDDYISVGIPAADVWLQSFDLNDILYWIENEPGFGAQAVYLDGSYRTRNWSPMEDDTWVHSMPALHAMGINYIAPPFWALLTLGDGKSFRRSTQKKPAPLVCASSTWTIERSGSLNHGGGWYYQSIRKAIANDGDVYTVIDVLAQQVRVVGIFSDWPATVTYYANCMGLK